MRLKFILVCSLIVFFPDFTSGQVKVRLFSNRTPESAVFSVTGGKYEINAFNGETLIVTIGEPVLITRYYGKLAVQTRNSKGFVCDSVNFTGKNGDDSFSFRLNDAAPAKQNYTGDLKCFPDLGTLLLINTLDIEKYIAGVVKAEGGSGKNIEYFKTQAVIARTYMYKYFDKHLGDGYNVCDNTHCQAFNGISSDTIINRSAMETHGQVILGKDSTLIIAAFHSNCGGETSSSEDVWLTSQPYLKSVIDPYCIASRNAKWEKKISLSDWVGYLMRSGYTGKTDDPPAFNFFQKARVTDYKTGLFTLQLRTIRTDLNLRSTFFSVATNGDSVILNGKGYGHGVGLCQEGAMAMALAGFSYQKIIDFYYFGVMISDVKNAVIIKNE